MNSFDRLLTKIKSKKAKIGVIGQGYVGLPLAVALAKKGFRVMGLDIDKEKVASLNRGLSCLPEMCLDKDLAAVVAKGFLRVTTAIVAGCREAEIIIICVPTPVDDRRRPDIRILEEAATAIGVSKPKGKLIINESTVAPSTTTSVVGKIIEKKSGLKIGRDFFLGCSPERINPGDSQHQLKNTPKVIAGFGREDLILVEAIYRQIIKVDLVKVSSLAVAEAVKLLENSYRAVNIALVNELALFCQRTGLDVLEIIEAAKSKWTFQAHYPGLGVGGHCIPVDPHYLLDEAARVGVKMLTLKIALAQNEAMPKFVLANFLKFYQSRKKVLVYGLAYKPNVSDLRESPALAFCHLLQKRRISFTVYDPFFTAAEIRQLSFKPGKIERYDILVVATAHAQLTKDSKGLVGKETIIIDGRNFFKEKVGRKVIGVGRRLD